MSDELDRESEIALELLRQLGPDGSPLEPPTETIDDASEVVRRLYLDSLAMLPYELEPVAPAAGSRDRLFMQLLGEETQEVAPVGDAGDGSERTQDVSPLLGADASTLPGLDVNLGSKESAEGPAKSDDGLRRAASVVDIDSRRGRRRERPPRRWPWIAAAAVFALATAGVGLWCASLVSELETETARVRSLERDLEQAKRAQTELTATRAELAKLSGRHDFTLAPGVAAIDLRPAGERPLQPYATGRLWVASDHRRWQLEVRGLPAEPDTQDYQLWFLIGDRPVNGGCFTVRAGEPGVLASTVMPEGTTAVAITLERKGGAPAPSGPMLLFGLRALAL